MRHSTTADFWKHYRKLPTAVRMLARKNYRLLRENPKHPGLHFKSVGPNTWSVRVGIRHRAVAARNGADFIWFWIGPHDEYERLIDG